MKLLKMIVALAVALAGLAAAGTAQAQHRHGHGHGPRVSIGIGFGFPYAAHPFYYPHFYSPFYYPPVYAAPVVVQQAPTVYIEQPPAPQQQSTGYWYYCNDARAYYPYVKECPAGWQRVAPQPGS